jgi:FkbM family methyltransferase
MRALKQLVSASLRGVGLELRKLRTYHTDPFGDQQRLLSGEAVKVVFDVGASEGYVTADYRRQFPDATVYSFEPTEAAFETLRRRFDGDPKVVPVRCAVGAEAGSATLYMHAFAQTNSLLPDDAALGKLAAADQVRSLGQQTVPVVRIDDFCAQKQIASIDLLKMDIQGFELSALKGARRMLDSHAVRLIYLEVLFDRLYQGQAFYHEIAAYLTERGYDLYGLYSLMKSSTGVLAQADAIFTSPDVRRRLG